MKGGRFMYAKRAIREEKRINYPEVTVNIVYRNNLWEVRCPLDFGNSLLKNDGTPKKDVEELARFVTKIKGGWDIVYYRSLAAIRNPLDRITWIYPKQYFTGRLRDSYRRLDIIKVDRATVLDVLNTYDAYYETNLPNY